MFIRSVLASICLVFLFLCPVRVYGQSYVSSGVSANYGYYNGANYLYCAGEFFYGNSGSGSYQWVGQAIKFDLTLVKYSQYDPDHPENNTPISTVTTTWALGNGEWMVQQWNPTTARISGAKFLSLEEGYIYSVTVTVKGFGSYRASFYQQFSSFQWTGQTSDPLLVDLVNPGDG
jgi:hypothetical protein